MDFFDNLEISQYEWQLGMAKLFGSFNSEELLDLFQRMVEVREFEESVARLYARGLVRGSTHLGQGQEAVSVGAAAVLDQGDTVSATYRGHAASLAMGVPLEAAFGEILGREVGACGGKGGSMHITDLKRGLLGSFAIVGAHLPISVGAALAAKQKGTGAVALTFFGDGSTNIGAFHEAMNMAAIWKLPLVFVCENNLYGEYSPLRATTPIDDLGRRADSYAMPAETVDGNDLAAVIETISAAVDRARSGEGPTFVEARTYRQQGHSRSDPATYRTDEELQEWLAHDPLDVFAKTLTDGGIADEAAIEARRTRAKELVDSARDAALASPQPDPGRIEEDVFA
jgi:acetoin:2,6-dichlorophenolindophenol oxidoreductase subunit alpha